MEKGTEEGAEKEGRCNHQIVRNQMQQGKLFLIPSFLGENNPAIIPQQVKDVVETLTEFIVEDARSARRYLRAIGFKKDFDTEVIIRELDKHAPKQNCDELLQNVLKGKSC